MGKILCIGDSLTEGAYFGAGMDGAAIEQNYPYYLGRMLNTEVVNAGVGGYSASDWYIEKAGDYDYTDYDTVIIWLGTNNGLTDTLDTDHRDRQRRQPRCADSADEYFRYQGRCENHE